MRFVSALLCIFALICCTTHAAFDEQASFSVQQHAKYDGIVSEVDFRKTFLSVFDDFKGQGFVDNANPVPLSDPNPASTDPMPPPMTECGPIKIDILAGINGAIDFLSTISPLPFLGVIKVAINTAATLINSLIGGTQSRVVVEFVFKGLEQALQAVSNIPIVGAIIKPVLPIINDIEAKVKNLLACMFRGNSAMKVIDEGHCTLLAGVYKDMIAESHQHYSSMSTFSSPDIQRLVAGTARILVLMEKTSIADDDEHLLSMTPIFAADLLGEYRRELIQVADTDELKMYAQAELALIMSMSNALEACLKIAADPVWALEDLGHAYEKSRQDDNGMPASSKEEL
ncbi:hypothetical protein BGW38_009402 [Lunasporangiospora selenospora]|uniref:Uncharacterized protein n=1 Tax=Lunasporangiospora selenospora TaxID=979761 RepID=A0A9P6KG69_9FUNG|nr:hypothetical protein BGW38_009402 [Lunasporangiospora selenospora]